MQIDFDGIGFDENGWDEAGLAGGLYVFADSKNRLRASWQYTRGEAGSRRHFWG